MVDGNKKFKTQISGLEDLADKHIWADNPEYALVSNDLEPSDLRKIKGEGYTLLEEVGEGNTRKAYRARHKGGTEKVVKIPKKDVGGDSICTIINISKKDVNDHERLVAAKLSNPYIAEPFESIVLDDGRVVNTERYHRGVDLEKDIKNWGRNEEKTKKIFGQLLDAMVYMHYEADTPVIHRDIKPSNIIVTDKGNILLTDLQNAEEKYKIQELSLPTRGGTQHTFPSLLNALLGGDHAKASERTDIYSFGTTLYKALTGEDAFNYEVKIRDDGKPVEIDGTIYKLALLDKDRKGNTEKLDDIITDERHEANLERALKKAPSKYRNLLRRCFTTKTRPTNTIEEILYGLVPKKNTTAFTDTRDVKKAFDDIQKDTFLNRCKEGIVNSCKYILPTAIGMGLLGAIVVGSINMSNQEPLPSFDQILKRDKYSEISMDNLNSVGNEYATDLLYGYMQKAKKQLQNMDPEDKETIKHCTDHSKNVHRMNKRLTSSWLRSCYIHKHMGFAERYEKESGQERIAPSLVPLEFVRRGGRNISHIGRDGSGMREYSKAAFGTMYMKLCLAPALKSDNLNIADVFAEYFSTDTQIKTAIQRTESMSYLPKSTAGDHFERGYMFMLPYYQTELINTATALYKITDEEGKVDFKKIPKLNWLPGTKMSRLRELRF